MSMSNLTKYFQGQRRHTFGEGKNKENNLSFRNIAANSQVHHQSQIKVNKVQTSFRSICDQSSSFYNAVQDLQEELNYVGGCVEHPHKRAEYFEQISQKQYCKLCAAQLASLGYKLEKSEHFVCRDISPTGKLNRKKQSSIFYQQGKDVNESRIKQTKSTNSNYIPVKFSTIFSQKFKAQSLQIKYEENQKIIDQFMNIYSDKMDKIEELINDIRIKDIQDVKKLKSENFQIYQEAKHKRETETQNGGYDLFGKSLLKENNPQNIKFKLPSEQKIQKLSKIIQELEQINSIKQQSISTNKIPLIKSICSNSSGNNTKDFLLKNSSSVSNLSSKSNFKKEKKENSNKDKFGSEINHTKHFIPEEPIESSRFSSNSAIIRKANNQTGNQIKTESTEMRRRKTEVSLGGSNSCEDTPESIKSKISSNSFVLPRNAAVTMFDKINVCESIDVKAEFAEKEVNSNNPYNKLSDGDTLEEKRQKISSSNRYKTQTQSSYGNRSGTNSVASKQRKSFHRYQNFDNQE